MSWNQFKIKYFWKICNKNWHVIKTVIYICLVIGIIVFLGQALYKHWQAFASIRINSLVWSKFVIATGITLFAFIWTGWIWAWILHDLGHPVNNAWAIQIYLTTNIAKYFPGNLVHFYGRFLAATNKNIPANVASLSIILDNFIMLSAGLIIGISSIYNNSKWIICLGLISVLVAMHPVVFRVLVHKLSQLTHALFKKQKKTSLKTASLKHYPWRPLIGEIGIITMRGLGFTLIVQSLISIQIQDVPRLVSIFSFGWLLGLITPGAPGGLGVFELTVSRLLVTPGILTNTQSIPYGLALGSVALYRFMSIVAEVIGASLAWLDIKRHFSPE